MSEETALGEALKVLKPRKRSKRYVRVCDECGVPLIWTFAFDYNERYCLNCGAMGGMLGTGEDVPATRELIFQEKIVNALWKILYGKKGLVPRSSQRTNCKKCHESNEKHYDHLSKAEAEWDKIAREYLKKLQGFLTPQRIENNLLN